MRRVLTGVRIIIVFCAYIWICQSFYLEFAADACLNAGLVFDKISASCSGATDSEWGDTGAKASYWFWFLLLSIPLIPTLLLNQLLQNIISLVVRTPASVCCDVGSSEETTEQGK